MDTEIQVVVQATCACELTWPLPCTRRRLSRRSCSCAAERPGTPPWSCAASSHARARTIPAALIVHRESLEWEYELAAKAQYWENRRGEMHDTELWTPGSWVCILRTLSPSTWALQDRRCGLLPPHCQKLLPGYKIKAVFSWWNFFGFDTVTLSLLFDN